jgi:hypothetical protein
MGLVVALDRSDLGRLVLEGVEAVLIPGEHLHRRDDRRHPHRHREHDPRLAVGVVSQQVKRTDGANGEGGGEVCGKDGVGQAVGEAGIEDDRPPVLGDELAGFVDRETGRRLHPAVGRQDPGGRDQRAERHHHGGEEMEPRPDALEPEQHDAEEAGLEEERRQHLVTHQRPDHRSGLVGERRPVGAELVAHDDTGNDTHAEGDGKDGLPVVE